jgi:hypothetical protein
MIKFTAHLESGNLELRRESTENQPNSTPESPGNKTRPLAIPQPISNRLLLTPHDSLRFSVADLLQQILAKSTYDGFKTLFSDHYQAVRQMINPNPKHLAANTLEGKLISCIVPGEDGALWRPAGYRLLPGTSQIPDDLLPSQPGRGVHE